MPKIPFVFIFILNLAFLPLNLQATHSLGGEITWTCLGNGQYKFMARYYRDCNGIPGPGSISLTTTIPGVPVIGLQLVQQTDISPAGFSNDGITACPTCTNGNGGAPITTLIEEYRYESFPVTLLGVPPANGWMFTWGECCRNSGINNLAPPVVPGLGLRAIMFPYNGNPANTCYDSSPYFVETPLTSSCVGFPVSYNHLAVDPDRDSLAYEWAAPLNDGFLPIPFAAGYSLNNQLPGPSVNPANSGASLNGTTGEINFTSYTAGRFTTCIKVTAYKCGQKVAEIYREVPLMLLNNCPTILGNFQNTPPVMNAPFINPVTGLQTEYVDTVYAGDTVSFNITFTDYDSFNNSQFQNITITGAGDVFGTNFTDPNQGCTQPPCATLATPLPTTTTATGQIEFNWVTGCNHVFAPGSLCLNNRYTFTFKATDNYCPANASSTSTITIVLLTREPLLPPVLRCASVNPDGSVSLNWTKSPSSDSLNIFQAYHVFASLSESGPFQFAGAVTSGINATSFTHTDAALTNMFGTNGSNQVIYYRVYTYSGCGNIPYSVNSNTIATIRNIATINPLNEVVLNWNAPSVPLLSSQNNFYNIYREYPAGTWTLLDSTTSLTFTDLSTSALCNTTLNYSIELIDSSGCAALSSISGTVVNSPAALSTITPPSPGICPGGNVTITAHYGQSYQWNTGATTQSINVNTPGNYTVTVTEPGGCTGTGTTLVTTFPAPNPVIMGVPYFCQGNGTNINAGSGYVAYQWSTGSNTQTIFVNSPGVYTATVTNSYGCTGSDTVTIVVNPLPNPVAVANGPTSFCLGDSVQLNVPGTFNSYQWFRFNAPVVPNAMQPAYSVKTRGAYKCRVSDANGCTNFSNTILVSIPCIPVRDEELKEGTSLPEIKVFPNPSNEAFYISGIEPDKYSISITDALGKFVVVEPVPGDGGTVRIAGLPPGWYVLSISDGKNSFFRKLVQLDFESGVH